MALCCVVGAVAGFAGYLYGYGRGISAPNPPVPSKRAVRGFSKKKAQAVLAAARTDGMVPIKGFESVVIASVQQSDGIFLAMGTSISGVRGPVEEFTISDQWRAFLKSERNMRLVDDAAK